MFNKFFRYLSFVLLLFLIINGYFYTSFFFKKTNSNIDDLFEENQEIASLGNVEANFSKNDKRLLLTKVNIISKSLILSQRFNLNFSLIANLFTLFENNTDDLSFYNDYFSFQEEFFTDKTKIETEQLFKKIFEKDEFFFLKDKEGNLDLKFILLNVYIIFKKNFGNKNTNLTISNNFIFSLLSQLIFKYLDKFTKDIKKKDFYFLNKIRFSKLFIFFREAFKEKSFFEFLFQQNNIFLMEKLVSKSDIELGKFVNETSFFQLNNNILEEESKQNLKFDTTKEKLITTIYYRLLSYKFLKHEDFIFSLFLNLLEKNKSGVNSEIYLQNFYKNLTEEQIKDISWIVLFFLRYFLVDKNSGCDINIFLLFKSFDFLNLNNFFSKIKNVFSGSKFIAKIKSFINDIKCNERFPFFERIVKKYVKTKNSIMFGYLGDYFWKEVLLFNLERFKIEILTFFQNIKNNLILWEDYSNKNLILSDFFSLFFDFSKDDYFMILFSNLIQIFKMLEEREVLQPKDLNFKKNTSFISYFFSWLKKNNLKIEHFLKKNIEKILGIDLWDNNNFYISHREENFSLTSQNSHLYFKSKIIYLHYNFKKKKQFFFEFFIDKQRKALKLIDFKGFF